MKKYFIAKIVFALFGISFLIQGCKSDNLPGEEEAILVLQEHFNKDVYKGLINLVDVKVVRGTEAEHLGGRYYDMIIETTIEIEKDYLVSKVFAVNAFGVSEGVAVQLETALTLAQSEQEKEEIKKMLDANFFRKGENSIEGTLGFVWYEGNWRVLNMLLWPKSPEGEGM